MVYRDIWVVIKLISQERMAQTTRFPMKNPKKKFFNDLSEEEHITSTPGAAVGPQLDFDAELESVLKKQVIDDYNNDDGDDDNYDDDTFAIFLISDPP